MQEPKNRGKYEQMMKMFSHAESKTELESISLVYIMDMSYERSDICLALKEAARESNL